MSAAQAQTYPNKTIRWIVVAPAGSSLVKERLKAAGLEPMGGTPKQFAQLIHQTLRSPH